MYVKWNTHGASYMCQLMREKVISLQNTSTNPSQQIHLHTHTQNGRSRCSAGASDMSQVTPNCLATSMATAFPPSMRMWRSMRLPWMPLLRYLPLALALARARARARTRAHAFFLSLSLSLSLTYPLSLSWSTLALSCARARFLSLSLSLSLILSLSFSPSFYSLSFSIDIKLYKNAIDASSMVFPPDVETCQHYTYTFAHIPN